MNKDVTVRCLHLGSSPLRAHRAAARYSRLARPAATEILESFGTGFHPFLEGLPVPAWRGTKEVQSNNPLGISDL